MLYFPKYKASVEVCCFSYLSVFTLEKVSVVFLLSVSTAGFISDHRVLYLIYKPVVLLCDVLPYRDISHVKLLTDTFSIGID